ncbi:DNA-binding SARP family transcriptional activator [Tamaricihabitans halophyticus]|uniref:DNA-binding SARP family transcriptional activator n=1 Tax=Tamaricihabitans halophyticus TaxID=1262583 RepID=A0A4R2QH38_9PSEU|nr:DNA-binding SARP family transcriptional activator [Tamaricihabitans halophyticus]
MLGPLQVERAGAVLPLGGPKPRLLLATLLLHPSSTVSTDTLIDVLWPDRPPASATANVHTYVHQLRRLITPAPTVDGAPRIVRESSGYQLELADEHLDMRQFRAACDTAREALRGAHTVAALAALDNACALWRGQVLAGLPGTPAWDGVVASLGEQWLWAQERRLALRAELDADAPSVLAELRGLLTEHPLHEPFWHQLINILREQDRVPEALQAYADLEQMLRAELDTEPSAPLRRLRADLANRAGPADTQALQPHTSAPPSIPPARQLPFDVPDFTGRHTTVAELTALLRDRALRDQPALVVLTGAPGIGKTALAVHLAHAARGLYPDGQLHVELGGTAAHPRQPSDVLAELLRGLGVAGSALPAGQAERAALLRSRLASARVCLLLEDASSAAQVAPLLPGTSRSAVLVTSRNRMPDLAGAYSVQLPALPEQEALRLLAAVAGHDRIAAEQPSAEEIVRACGGLPLAVRIAGAKLAGRSDWSLALLAERLRDERDRLDELRIGDLEVRAAVELSYALLDTTAARGFRLLSTLGQLRFPSWVLAALLDLAGAEHVLDTLVDASLVELAGTDACGQPRYRLPELVRCHAIECADTDDIGDRLAALRRVLEGYLALIGDATSRIPARFLGLTPGPKNGHWRPAAPSAPRQPCTAPLDWLGAEIANVVALVSVAAEGGLPDLAWRLAAAYTPYFDLRGLRDVWRDSHEIALRAAREAGSSHGEAVIRRNQGQLYLYQDLYPQARIAFEAAHDLFESLGQKHGAAVARTGLASVARHQGDNERSLAHCETALSGFRAMDDLSGSAVAMLGIGSVWLERSAYPAAADWFDSARQLCARIGDQHREAHANSRLGGLRRLTGALQVAREHLQQAITIFEELGDEQCVSYARQELGAVFLDDGELARAKPLLVDALRVHQRRADRRGAAEVAELLGRLHEALGRPDRALGYRTRARSLWASLEAGSTRGA